MSRALSLLVALLVLLATALPVAAKEPAAATAEVEPPTSPVEGEAIPGEVIVKWLDEGKGPEVATNRGLAVVAELGRPGKGVPSLLSTEGRPVDQVLAELRADPSVEYAEPNYRVYLANEGTVTGVPVNDPKTGDQYSLNQMRVRDAWSLSRGASNLIAVLDTGVQFNHPDLKNRLVAGYDFVNDDADASDDNGHGTWVSGIIAANANDGYGIAGISWSDKILPVKIMSREGTGSTADLAAGIRYAADKGAKVINMSVGGFPYLASLQDAVNYAWSKGAVLIGAAGNNRREESYYPASYNNVVSVSATQVNDEFSNWSSYGPKVDVSAPGSSVLTTNCYACTYADHDSWGSHTYISGTSFATPNVAGVVALIRARYPSWTPQQVVDRLIGTVDDLGYPGWDDRYGRGRVNAYRALGGSVSAPSAVAADALEPNNSLAAAKKIALGSTTRPNIHPAADVDFFAVDVPRAGRLDVRVTGVVDSREYPWNKSGLPVDPIVQLYNTAGTRLVSVDNVWENGTELAQVSVGGPTRIIVRVSNWYPNGNRAAYGITPSFVDTVAPALSARTPGPSAANVSTDGALTTTFNEPVSGVSASTMLLRDSAGRNVASTVSYSSSSRVATLRPNASLAPEAKYSLHLTSGIKDSVGHALAATSWSFTTGKGLPRVAGANRFETSAALSRSAFGAGVPVAYVATGMSYPDALAGGPAARAAGGPLLLTEYGRLSAATASELTRLQPKKIVVLGGTSAVSATVASALGHYTSGTVQRVSGADRFATAAAISRSAFPGGASTVYIATGENYPDALAAGAVAARNGAPILLVRSNAVPSATVSALRSLDPDRIVVMGGTSVISNAVASQLAAYGSVSRVSGADRYATSVELSKATFGANSVSTVYVATGKSFPDGLSAGPVAGLRGGPLLLVPGTSLPASVATELKRLDPTNIVVVGGTTVISNAVREQMRALWR